MALSVASKFRHFQNFKVTEIPVIGILFIISMVFSDFYFVTNVIMLRRMINCLESASPRDHTCFMLFTPALIKFMNNKHVGLPSKTVWFAFKR